MELRTAGKANELDAWLLERDVCDRALRQLRCVGDALAWKVFDHQRNYILVLSRNEPPGPMTGKVGLTAERAFLTSTWREAGRFAILHDLTSCLRIGDATVFTREGAILEEIKTNERRRTAAQEQRRLTAAEALRSRAPMPGGAGQVLVKIDLPYRTHLDILRDVLDLARQRGLQRAKVPGGRALVAANLFTAPKMWSEEGFVHEFRAELETAKRQAKIVSSDEITLGSIDQVGLSPVIPPWAIYPLSPEMCASLIADDAFFYVSMSSTEIIAALAECGISAQWLQALDANTKRDQPWLQIDKVGERAGEVINVRRTSMNFSELSRLLFELVDLEIWAEHVAILMQSTELDGVPPWPYFINERNVWL